jgi:GNAT superfamily N-acetyltransferase
MDGNTARYAGPMIELVPREEILDLRSAVLRPGRPRHTAEFPADRAPGTFHVAERAPDGTVIGCGTFMPEPIDGEILDGDPGDAVWRLRGMATAPEHQGEGVGSRVLAAGIAEVAARGGRLLWCNGRVSAAGFYQRHGFTIHGDAFDIPPIGPHFVLTLEIARG